MSSSPNLDQSARDRLDDGAALHAVLAGDPEDKAPAAEPLVAHAVAVRRRGNARIVEVLCPHCARRHAHAWPWGDTAPGHRVSHCGSGGYYIPAPSIAGETR